MYEKVLTVPEATGYAITLPASPANGQEAILVDSITAPTYQWRFRYNAAAATYKWEFIGGAAYQAHVNTDEAHAGTGWANLATDGPSFTIPRAGVYRVYISSREYYASAEAATYIGVDSSLDAVLQNTYQQPVPTAPVGTNSAVAADWQITLAAAEVIKVQYYASVAAHFMNRVIAVSPVRVS